MKVFFQNFYQWIPIPVYLHTTEANLYLTIILTVHFAMNINMQKRCHLQRIFSFAYVVVCPLMQNLVERTFLNVVFDEIVGIEIFLVYTRWFSPDTERVALLFAKPRLSCQRSCQVWRIYLSQMDSYFFVIYLASSV